MDGGGGFETEEETGGGVDGGGGFEETIGGGGVEIADFSTGFSTVFSTGLLIGVGDKVVYFRVEGTEEEQVLRELSE